MKKLYLRTDHIGPHQMVLREDQEPPLFDPARWELLVEGDDDVIGQVSQALERELQSSKSAPAGSTVVDGSQTSDWS